MALIRIGLAFVFFSGTGHAWEYYRSLSTKCILYSKKGNSVVREHWSTLPEARTRYQYLGKRLKDPKTRRDAIYFVYEKKIYYSDPACFIKTSKKPPTDVALSEQLARARTPSQIAKPAPPVPKVVPQPEPDDSLEIESMESAVARAPQPQPPQPPRVAPKPLPPPAAPIARATPPPKAIPKSPPRKRETPEDAKNADALALELFDAETPPAPTTPPRPPKTPPPTAAKPKSAATFATKSFRPPKETETKPSPPPSPDEAPPSATTTAIKSVPYDRVRWSRALEFAVIGWQEAISLTDSTGKEYDLRANYYGLCPGGNFVGEFSSTLAIKLGACLLIMQGEVADASNAKISFGYRGNAKPAYGLFANVGVQWTPPVSRLVRVGLSVPLIFRSNTQADPPADTTMSPGNTALFPGLLLEFTFEHGPWTISPKTGVLNFLSGFAWGLQVNYKL